MRNDVPDKRLGQLRLFVASLWLAMVTAIFSAVLPVGAPLTVAVGSAFNPSTTQVALGASSAGIRATAEADDDGSPQKAASVTAPDALPPILMAGIPVPLATADGVPSPYGVVGAPARNPRETAQPRAPPHA
ncbi:hypothetical protein P1X14_14760 [Sphingomonas sp. AOB5]|uniref:hypothetical protein n=1 Tax=Sphingomonas sp. AOB5 TaxID=3034017 RepID=UPI0023F7CD27|nr:hypothetical protein [Sphingomonas sp. AOB5]MDF7776514.1 hypothetical protein [Sphingomonas sp. AOB5]